MKHLTLTISDYFLPDDAMSPDLLLRARMAIFMILSFAVFMTLILLGLLALQRVTAEDVVVSVLAILAQVLFLFLIKKTRSVEWVAIVYLLLTDISITTECLFRTKTLLYNGLPAFPVFLVLGFFISADKVKRTLLIVFTLICSTISVFGLRDIGFVNPFGLNAEKYIYQTMAFAAAKSAVVFLCMYFYVKLKTMAQQDLEREITWQHRQARLNEAGLVIRSCFPELKEPLLNLERVASGLQHERQEMDELGFIGMGQDIEQMLQVAQSVAWIYRAYRDESVGPTAAYLMHEQLGILLRTKVKGSLWSIHLVPLEETFEVEGPIPSVILLLLSLMDQGLDMMTDGQETQNLWVRMRRLGDEVICTLCWDSKVGCPRMSRVRNEGLEFSRSALRSDLIQDLQRGCAADIQEYSVGKQCVICLKGNWVTP